MSFSVPGTGCAGFGAVGDLLIRRAIHSLDIDFQARTAVISASLFLEKTSPKPAYITVIHRGVLNGYMVTRGVWKPENPSPIRDRIVTLHENDAPIGVGRDAVRLDGKDYSLGKWSNEFMIPLAGGRMDRDENAPFTLWRFGPFDDTPRSLVQFELRMTPETYSRQIGSSPDQFYLYGDAILLDRIQEDTDCYSGYLKSERERYTSLLNNYRATRQTPEVFEYILASDPAHPLEATPLSYNFSQRWMEKSYKETTHWFMAYHKGPMKTDNAFALKVNVPERHLEIPPPDTRGQPAGGDRSSGVEHCTP